MSDFVPRELFIMRRGLEMFIEKQEENERRSLDSSLANGYRNSADFAEQLKIKLDNKISEFAFETFNVKFNTEYESKWFPK